MKYEWDPRKNKTNLQKHGVSFETAKEIFDDPLHISFLDERFDYFEERWITIGATKGQNILIVANIYIDIEEDMIIRIISARPASTKEIKQYEE